MRPDRSGALGWRGHRSRCGRCAISATYEANYGYADGFVAEDELLTGARERGKEFGATPIGPGGGAALRMLAAAAQARAVVEVGTGAGVSGLWLLRGMAADGVLTTIDTEAEHQRAAKAAFTADGVPTSRVRAINGRAGEVLPRLADASYDLVFVDADKPGYADYVEQGVRLLRPGGVLAVDNTLWHDRVADPSVRDEQTVGIRAVNTGIRDDERLVPCLLPVGDGLLVAVRRED